jgi:hypothetical protein
MTSRQGSIYNKHLLFILTTFSSQETKNEDQSTSQIVREPMLKSIKVTHIFILDSYSRFSLFLFVLLLCIWYFHLYFRQQFTRVMQETCSLDKSPEYSLFRWDRYRLHFHWRLTNYVALSSPLFARFQFLDNCHCLTVCVWLGCWSNSWIHYGIYTPTGLRFAHTVNRIGKGQERQANIWQNFPSLIPSCNAIVFCFIYWTRKRREEEQTEGTEK